MKRSSFTALNYAWAALAFIQIRGVQYAVHGLSTNNNLSLWTASIVLLHDICEDCLGQLLERSLLVQIIMKNLHKIIKGSSITVQQLGVVAVTLLLLAVNLCWPSVDLPLRLALVLIFALKLPSETALHRCVALQRYRCSRHAQSLGLAQSALLYAGCLLNLPFVVAQQELALESGNSAIDSASLEHILLSTASANANNTGSTIASTSVSANNSAGAEGKVATEGARGAKVKLGTAERAGGSSALTGVLCFTIAVAVFTTFCTAVPLLSALLSEGVMQPNSAITGYNSIYAPWHCAALLIGVAVQSAALAFAAGYLQYRRSIALELRQPLPLSTIGSASRRLGLGLGLGLGTDISSSGSSDAAERATEGELPVQLPVQVGLVISNPVWAMLLAVVDCDTRTVCAASGGVIRRCATDNFACGISPVVVSTAALSVPIAADGDHGSGNTQGKLAVAAATTQQAVGKGGTNTGSSKSASQNKMTSAAGTGASNKALLPAVGSTAQAAGTGVTGAGAVAVEALVVPQYYVLNLCLLLVAAVAVVQLVLVLCGLLSRRCADAALLMAAVGLVVVLALRVWLPLLSGDVITGTGTGVEAAGK